MRDLPLVSVVLPTRNRATLLTRAANSVLAQSYTRLELVIVDDASSDTTASAVAALADPRVRAIRLNENRGAAGARNAGIAAARGELIAFQDDDDQWTVCKLERQVGALLAAPPGTALCLCGHIRISPRECRYFGGVDAMASMNFIGGISNAFSLVATPGWLVRRSALERTGSFDERLRSWEDWDLALRLFRDSGMVFVDEPLFLQDRMRTDTLWSDERLHAANLRVLLEKHASLWAPFPRVRSRHAFLIGRAECQFGDVRAGRRSLREAILLDPGNWRAYAALAFSLAGPRALGLARRLGHRLLRLAA